MTKHVFNVNKFLIKGVTQKEGRAAQYWPIRCKARGSCSLSQVICAPDKIFSLFQGFTNQTCPIVWLLFVSCDKTTKKKKERKKEK